MNRVQDNIRTRAAVRVCNWILRTFAPGYAEVLSELVDRELRRVGVR